MSFYTYIFLFARERTSAHKHQRWGGAAGEGGADAPLSREPKADSIEDPGIMT